MKYGDGFKHNETKSLWMCLGLSEDKLTTYFSIIFYLNGIQCELSFVPYHSEALDGLEFIGSFSPNLLTLEEQMKTYKKRCEDSNENLSFNRSIPNFMNNMSTCIKAGIEHSGESQFLREYNGKPQYYLFCCTRAPKKIVNELTESLKESNVN